MIYPKRFSIDLSVEKNTNNLGFVLVDIVLALSIATVLISVMAEVSITSSNSFNRAKSRSVLLDIYEAHQADFVGLMPHMNKIQTYSVGSSTITISASAKWYGNDRIETDIDVSDGKNTVDFVAVRNYPTANQDDFVGTPLCSPDFSLKNQVGSYQFNNPSRQTDEQVLNIKQIFLPINPLLPLTDLIVRKGVAYIASDSSSAVDPDLFIADISSTTAPLVLSSINTGPGLAAISLVKNYIFAAAASTAAQLHVIGLNSLSSLQLLNKYQLPLPESSTTPPMASSIFYDKNIVYLGSDKWNGEELSLIDMLNPLSPNKISGLEINSRVNSIYVRNGLMYLGTSDRKQLITANVQTPISPYEISYESPSGWSRQDGKVVSSFEDSLTFGRTSGGFDISSDYELFSWLSDSTTTLMSRNVPGGIYGIVRDRNRVYVATRTPNQELTVFDNFLGTTSVSYYPLSVQPQSMTCDNNKIYILAKTAPVIYEITSNTM